MRRLSIFCVGNDFDHMRCDNRVGDDQFLREKQRKKEIYFELFLFEAHQVE